MKVHVLLVQKLTLVPYYKSSRHLGMKVYDNYVSLVQTFRDFGLKSHDLCDYWLYCGLIC